MSKKNPKITAETTAKTTAPSSELTTLIDKRQKNAIKVQENLSKLGKDRGPAAKMITEQKVNLIECLMADHSFILQHVHAKEIVTDRQYQNLKYTSQPGKTVTDLIDCVIFKGEDSCSRFIEVLKEPEVVDTYPQLKEITKKWR